MHTSVIYTCTLNMLMGCVQFGYAVTESVVPAPAPLNYTNPYVCICTVVTMCEPCTGVYTECSSYISGVQSQTIVLILHMYVRT